MGVRTGMRGSQIYVFPGPSLSPSPPCPMGLDLPAKWHRPGEGEYWPCFLALGLKLPVPAKAPELQGTISADAPCPVALGKSIL